MKTLLFQNLKRIRGEELYELLRQDLQQIEYVRVFERLAPGRRPKLFCKSTLGRIPLYSLPTIGNEVLEIIRSSDRWFTAYHPAVRTSFRRQVYRVLQKHRIDLSDNDSEVAKHARWLRSNPHDCISQLIRILIQYANFASANPGVAPPGLG